MDNQLTDMFVSTKYRSDEPEIMDDFSMKGELLRDALDKIAGINQILGGNSVTIEGLEGLFAGKPTADEVITVLDVGCGNGDMLRALARYGMKKGIRFKLYGIDANEFTIAYAKDLSADYEHISYVCGDIFEEVKQEQVYDVILCTLTLHHFKDEGIIALLENLRKRAKMGIVINDLHRSSLAYYLFQLICFTFRLNRMSREDGLISILRGFKKADLTEYSRKLNLKNYSIRWKWAFRYQWIISTR